MISLPRARRPVTAPADVTGRGSSPWFDAAVSRRLLVPQALSGLAVAAALVHAIWMLFFLDRSPSDGFADGTGLLAVLVVPVAMAASGAALLPRSLGRLRWSLVPAVALAAVAVALGVAAGFLADDLVGPRPSSAAVDPSVIALVLAIAGATTAAFVAWTTMPAVTRAFLAVVLGAVGTGAIAGLFASVIPPRVAAVTQLALLIVLHRRIPGAAPLGRAA